jgi:hypothetical protein
VTWAFVIALRAPDGTYEQREFVVRDEHLATLLRRILFDKNASTEEIEEFAREISADPALARELDEIKKHLKCGWSIN